MHRYKLFLLTLFLVLIHSVLASQSLRSDIVIGDPDLSAYPFEPGDGLKINTFPDTSSFLNGTFAIDDRGFAEFPIVGKVKVSAMTTAELTNFIRDTFKGWLRNPNIYVKPMVRVSLLGGFQRPGLYYVDYNSSLWDVVRRAGGPILEEGVYDMKWERNGDERDGDLTKYFESGISLKRMGFQSGDQIRTPPIKETFWGKLNQNIIPIVSFATSMAMLYFTYQQQMLYYSSGRRF